MEEEEDLRNIHLEYLKEAAQLLTEEGELISNAQGVGGVDYDIDEYVTKMERIVKRNLQIYSHLNEKIVNMKRLLKEEEEASHKVTGAFFY
jgi:hypothetical protein